MLQSLTGVSAHAAALGIFGGAIAFIWSVTQFWLQRRRESDERQFEAYHKLVKELVSPDSAEGVMWIQRQAAVIFELRHFPRYYEFTERLLISLREKWDRDPEFHWPALLNEIDLTLRFMKRGR
jgi:hypothetical protein